MSKRYYISPIVGDGTEENSFRPKVADYPVKWVGIIPSDPVTGLPLFAWTLVLVEAQNHGQLISDGAIDPMPEFPLDGKVSAIHNATKNDMLARLQARGIDTTFIGNADGYRDVIRGVGRHLEPTFDENNFDVI